MKTVKITLAAVLAIVLICGMLPVQAMAAEPQLPTKFQSAEIPAQVNPLYDHIYDVEDLALPEPVPGDASTLAEVTYVSETAAVTQIREHMKARTGSFEVYVQSADSDYSGLFGRMFVQAMAHTGEPTEGDYLLWQYAGRGGNVSYSQSGSTYYYAFTYNVTYYTTAEQETQMDEAVAALLAELSLTGKSDYDKICAVYDWICANITYDYDNLEDTTYKLKHTAYAALINKTAVCQGYAVLLYRLMLELDVDIRVIVGIGNGGGHAWNIVELDDLYYNADPTWDASWHQSGLEYEFFLRNEVNFTENGTDHIRNDEYSTEEFLAAYPMGETDYEPKANTDLASGTCGENLTWELAEGVLTISGEGEMYNFDTYNYNLPWGDYVEDITTVVIEEGVTTVGDYAFGWHTNLTEVQLPSTITRIGHLAFVACTKLGNVDFPEALTTIGEAAFIECESMTELVIPASVTAIQGGAFALCVGVTEITFLGDAPDIPNDDETFMSVTATVYYPANNATWTADVMQNYGGTLTWIPYGEPVIEEIASGWSGATQWTLTSDGVLTVYGEGNMKNYGWSGGQPWAGYADQITSLVIEEGVTAVGSGAFKDMTALKSVTLPDSGLSKIGIAAFYGCTALEEIYIPEGIYTIWEYTFKNCSGLKSVRLPKTLIKIDQGAFEACTGLAELFLPTNVQIIGGWSFKGCTGMTSVDMQWADATEIRAGAFKNCTALTNIVLPSNIQTLGDSCFYGIGATSFTVPETVTTIADWCFARSSIQEITFAGDAPAIGTGAFNKITLTAYYPSGNATWTSDIMQNYGGNVTWEAN